MHDKNGTPLNLGDNVILTGTITSIEPSTDSSPSVLTIVTHEGGRVGIPGMQIILTPRMVIKGTPISPERIQEALRGAAFHIRELRQQIADQRRIAKTREDVLQETIVCLGQRGYPQDNCGAIRTNSIDGHSLASRLERLADLMIAPTGPCDANQQDGDPSAQTATQAAANA